MSKNLALADHPMKKIAIGLAVAGVLILAGVVVFKSGGGPSQAAALAPADAVIFVNVPNIPLTGFRWTRSSLAQIAAEPEVRAFLEKPLAELKSSSWILEKGGLLKALKPGNVYFAATLESEENSRGIVGVQFWGKRADFDNVIAELRSSLPPGSGETQREDYRGLEILISQHGDLLLHTAAAGRWGFLSNDASLIKEAIDRATGNSQAPGLASNPNFLKVISELLTEPDLLVFVQPERAVTSLLAAGRSLDATPITEHVDQLRSAEAIGGAWKIDGEMFRDAFFMLRPGCGDPATPLDHQAMALTTPETTVFLNFNLNFSQLPKWMEGISEIHPEIANVLDPLAHSLAKGYGPECAILCDMADVSVTPSMLLAMQVKNPEANLLATTASAVSASSGQNSGNRTLHFIPNPYLQISAAQDERFLLFGTNPEQLTKALESHSKTLQDSPLFQKARTAYRYSNEAFCFIDTRTLFERGYSSALPILRMGAAMWPEISNRIDVSKLPKPSAIGQHLPPIVYSQNRSANGTRSESSGPISMSQFLLLSAVARSLGNLPH